MLANLTMGLGAEVEARIRQLDLKLGSIEKMTPRLDVAWRKLEKLEKAIGGQIMDDIEVIATPAMQYHARPSAYATRQLSFLYCYLC